jgi:hypothetical protein
MSGETDLGTILAGLTVSKRPGSYVFVPLPTGHIAGADVPVVIREEEGTTVIVPTEVARERGWDVSLETAWLTIDVHTSLEAVGLTAAMSRVLADASIPCNVVAGFYHDHLFVPLDQVDTALEAIAALGSGSGMGDTQTR